MSRHLNEVRMRALWVAGGGILGRGNIARAETLVCSNKATVAGLQLEKGSIVGKERSVR